MSKIDIPKHLRGRPVYNGYVVPFFVSWYLPDGSKVNERTPNAKPNFPIIDMDRAQICRKRNACWICGKQLGTYRWFVMGPGSAITRTALEPPSHRDCAKYAVRVCPFMLNPNKQINNNAARNAVVELIGSVPPDNPGVSVLWATKSYDLLPVDPSRGIFYYRPHEPDVVEFWREGRHATRAEIDAAIDRSLARGNATRDDREYSWNVKHLLGFAPDKEQAA